MDWFTKLMVTAVVAILALAVVRDVCAQPRADNESGKVPGYVW